MGYTKEEISDLENTTEDSYDLNNTMEDNYANELVEINPDQLPGLSDSDSADQNNPISKRYFVDYENTGGYGLDGIQKLNEEDCVYVFYSENRNTVPIDFLESISQTKATLKWVKVPIGDQVADKHLIARLGVEIGRLGVGFHYYIVSKDKGFESVAATLKNYCDSVKTIPSISGNVPPEQKTNECKKSEASTTNETQDLSKLNYQGNNSDNMRNNWTVFYNLSSGKLTKDEIQQIRYLLLENLKTPANQSNHNFKFYINNCLHKVLGTQRGTQYLEVVS